jgi:hypothetical protein
MEGWKNGGLEGWARMYRLKPPEGFDLPLPYGSQRLQGYSAIQSRLNLQEVPLER